MGSAEPPPLRTSPAALANPMHVLHVHRLAAAAVFVVAVLVVVAMAVVAHQSSAGSLPDLKWTNGRHQACNQASDFRDGGDLELH